MYSLTIQNYIVIKDSNDTIPLQEDLNKMISWSDIWLHKFNNEKCKLLTVNSSIDISYFIHINTVCYKQDTVNNENNIDVTLDSKLRFDLYIKYNEQSK